MDGNDLAERMRVAIARDERTQGEIAERLGWAPSKLSGYVTKSGKPAMPGADTLAKFARELGVSGHWLLTGEGPMYPESPDAERQAYHEMAAIVRRTEAAASYLGDTPLTPDAVRARRERLGLGPDGGPRQQDADDSQEPPAQSSGS